MNLSLASIRKQLARFFGRFHVIIFFITVASGLSVIILLLNNVIVTSSNSEGYTPNTNSASFDQATIDRVKQLKTRDEASGQLNLSNGRTNPFVE